MTLCDDLAEMAARSEMAVDGFRVPKAAGSDRALFGRAAAARLHTCEWRARLRAGTPEGDKRGREAIRAIKDRLDRAAAEGEIAGDLDTTALASFYAAFVQGLTTLIAAMALTAWPSRSAEA